MDIDLLRKWFSYDPETGIITRKLSIREGSLNVLNPKQKVNWLGTKNPCAKIAWALHHGVWPLYSIDHINHDNLDNKLVNLREATKAENMRNRRWNNPNGKGVTFRHDRRDDPWQAQIACNGQKIHLGFYDTKEEAAEAYRQAALEYHGEFACLK